MEKSEIDAHVEALARARGVGITPISVGDGGETQLARKLRIVGLYRSQLCSFVTDGIASHAARVGGRERLWVTDAFRQVLSRSKTSLDCSAH
jgi:hypothetical protein